MRDGKAQFFRNVNVDRETMKLLYAFQVIKKQMINDEKDAYLNGKILKEE